MPQNVKLKLPFDPGILFLGIFPKGLKSSYYPHSCAAILKPGQFMSAEP